MSENGADEVVGRFAPSPTGPLHIGSLVAAVGSYLLARQAGGRWLLRMEDLDTPRVVPGSADDIMRTLEAFSLEWDGSVVWQSSRQESYLAAFEVLKAAGHLFPCTCSRAEIARTATAPHDGEGEVVYPGTCREGITPGKAPRAYRVRVNDQPLRFHDLVQGEQVCNLGAICGDFVIRRADGPFAYQLAVVVDDGEQLVNQVVRGADLLTSTPRQILLQNYLELPTPVYAHLPLVIGQGGGKLSKRDTSVSLRHESELPHKAWSKLASALSCLGVHVPSELYGASCRIILEWAVRHLDLSRIPRGPIEEPSQEDISA